MRERPARAALIEAMVGLDAWSDDAERSEWVALIDADEAEARADCETRLAALRDLPWLDDIIRSLEVGMNSWHDAHRNPTAGSWTFVGADGPFHELTQSTLRRLKDYRAALTADPDEETT